MLREMLIGWVLAAAQFLRVVLPEGGTLTKADRRQRHRAILWLLWLHAIALAGLALWTGNSLAHSVTEAAAVLPWAIAGDWPRLPYRLRSVAASVGLLTASVSAEVQVSGAPT
jgi:hypothetical protein